MTIACETIRVWKPAHIEATNMIFDVTDCDEPCTVTATVTWTNTGGRTGSFTPNISVDGTPISPAPYTSEDLAGGASVTHAFSISGLSAVSPYTDHTICPMFN